MVRFSNWISPIFNIDSLYIFVTVIYEWSLVIFEGPVQCVGLRWLVEERDMSKHASDTMEPFEKNGGSTNY